MFPSKSDVSIKKFQDEFFDGNIAYRSVMNWMETM